MKKIEAFVRHTRLGFVKKSLAEIGHRSMINYDIWYRGTENEINLQQTDGITPLYDFMPKAKIEIVAEDEEVKKIIEVISASAGTGHTGDGKIFLSKVEEAIRIQTRETGDIVL